MAEKQDPSIYDDRSSIGSSDDLDEYGVWVKSEPQDLSSSLPEIEELPDIAGIGDDSAELPDFADFSSSESDTLGISSDDSMELTDDDLSIPDVALDLPDDDLSIPDVALDLPDDDLSIPDVALDLPDDDLSIPGASLDLPDDNLSLSDISFDLPEDNLEIPEESLDLPESEPLDKPFSQAPDNTAGLDDDDDDDLPSVGPLGGVDLEFEELPDDVALPEKKVSSEKSGGFDAVSMDDFIDPPTPSKSSGPQKIDFGNLDEVVGESGAISSASKGGSDLSNQLLMKIADELSSIKKEISSLKTELAGVKGEVKADADAKGGFFDEEDDEKIALTGDELDNILNTADFIEESGSDEGIDSALSEQDIISETPEEEAFSEETFPKEADLDESIDLSFDESGFSEESPELNELRETGAKAFTPPPEDTSYLEADPLAASPIDVDDGLDLSGAVIDEPDLSSQIVENPVFEPELDNISIDIEPAQEQEQEQGADDFVFEVEDTMEIGPGEDLLTETDDFTSPPPSPGGSMEAGSEEIPSNLKQELKTVLSYMDQLLEALPDEKIEEFAKSEYFETYKKLFEELGLT